MSLARTPLEKTRRAGTKKGNDFHMNETTTTFDGLQSIGCGIATIGPGIGIGMLVGKTVDGGGGR